MLILYCVIVSDGLVSFVLPSAMCVQCAADSTGRTAAPGRPWLGKAMSGFEVGPGSAQWWADVALLALGVLTCVGATFITVAASSEVPRPAAVAAAGAH